MASSNLVALIIISLRFSVSTSRLQLTFEIHHFSFFSLLELSSLISFKVLIFEFFFFFLPQFCQQSKVLYHDSFVSSPNTH